MPNLRKNPRGRPQMEQRLCCRAENFGFFLAFALADVVAMISLTIESVDHFKSHSSKAGMAFPDAAATLWPGRPIPPWSQWSRSCLSACPLGVINFWKNQLVFETQGVIPAPVKGLSRDPAKITHSRQGNIHQPVQELVHAFAAQRHHGPDRHAFADLESGNGFLGSGHY